MVSGAGLLSFVVYDYHHLKTLTLHAVDLERRLSNQTAIIETQRKQIQNFANNINLLKSKLLDLNDFEQKIRSIADIEKTAEQEGLFGVGGSVPEDLDARLPLTRKHSTLVRNMHEQVHQLEQASAHQHQDFESLLESLQQQHNILACTPTIRPTKGWVTSRFGYRKSPFTGQREFHKGLDIATRKGTPILAPADGIISQVSRRGLLGKVLVIDHGHGIVTRYAHLQKALKKKGERVNRGDAIALVGSSGRTTGSHLHYEVYVSGVPVNPQKYILN